jgi:hypothetical protein
MCGKREATKARVLLSLSIPSDQVLTLQIAWEPIFQTADDMPAWYMGPSAAF